LIFRKYDKNHYFLANRFKYYVQGDVHVKKPTFTAPRKERTKWKPTELGNFNCEESTVHPKSIVDVQDSDKFVMEQVLLISKV
jgi:hypothetical protein